MSAASEHMAQQTVGPDGWASASAAVEVASPRAVATAGIAVAAAARATSDPAYRTSDASRRVASMSPV